jgi:hypothetical protein
VEALKEAWEAQQKYSSQPREGRPDGDDAQAPRFSLFVPSKSRGPPPAGGQPQEIGLRDPRARTVSADPQGTSHSEEGKKPDPPRQRAGPQGPGGAAPPTIDRQRGVKLENGAMAGNRDGRLQAVSDGVGNHRNPEGHSKSGPTGYQTQVQPMSATGARRDAYARVDHPSAPKGSGSLAHNGGGPRNGATGKSGVNLGPEDFPPGFEPPSQPMVKGFGSMQSRGHAPTVVPSRGPVGRDSWAPGEPKPASTDGNGRGTGGHVGPSMRGAAARASQHEQGSKISRAARLEGSSTGQADTLESKSMSVKASHGNGRARPGFTPYVPPSYFLSRSTPPQEEEPKGAASERAEEAGVREVAASSERAPSRSVHAVVSKGSREPQSKADPLEKRTQEVAHGRGPGPGARGQAPHGESRGTDFPPAVVNRRGPYQDGPGEGQGFNSHRGSSRTQVYNNDVGGGSGRSRPQEPDHWAPPRARPTKQTLPEVVQEVPQRLPDQAFQQQAPAKISEERPHQPSSPLHATQHPAGPKHNLLRKLAEADEVGALSTCVFFLAIPPARAGEFREREFLGGLLWAEAPVKCSVGWFEARAHCWSKDQGCPAERS